MVSKDTLQEALDILIDSGLLEKDNEGRYKLTLNGQRYAIATGTKDKHVKGD